MTDCRHRKPPRLPYIAAHADARKRMKRGQGQQYCPHCRRWIWGEFWHAPAPRREAEGE